MEAHLLFTNAHLTVASYGTGSQVKLPGKTAMEPKVFKFGVSYEKMYESLAAEDVAYFSQNGILALCRRGASCKDNANSWQGTSSKVVVKHDVVVVFEERLFDAVIEDLQMREPTDEFKPIVVICLDTKDNPTEAAKSARNAMEMCWRIDKCENLVEEVGEIVEEFSDKMVKDTGVKVLYQTCYL
jgi:RNA polymerase II subunit A C-terminal domain phosphatase SSU72